MRAIYIFSVLLYFVTACSSDKENKNDSKDEQIGYKLNKEWIEVSPKVSGHLTGDLTIDITLKLHSYPSAWTTIISKFESALENEFTFRIKNEQIAHWNYGSGSEAIVLNWKPNKIPLNKWVKLTAIRDMQNETMKVLLNNKIIAKKKIANKPVSETTKKIVILGDKKRFLDATVKDIKIWKKALSKSELEKFRGKISNPGDEMDLIGYWIFNEVVNDEIKDLSFNKDNAKINVIK